jgi:hypothetical protein
LIFLWIPKSTSTLGILWFFQTMGFD